MTLFILVLTTVLYVGLQDDTCVETKELPKTGCNEIACKTDNGWMFLDGKPVDHCQD